MTDLSGRVDSLETANTWFQQQLLQRPDMVAFNNFQTIWNQEMQTIADTLYEMNARLQNLIGLYTNMNISQASGVSLFRSHTGNVNIHDVRQLAYQNFTGLTGIIQSGTDIVYADATTNDILTVLTGVSVVSGLPLIIKKIDTTVHTVTVTGDALIDGSLTYLLTGNYVSVYLVNNGVEWYTV